MASDRELERELRDLGTRVEYPQTPDLARTVRRRIDQERPARSRTIWPSLPRFRWAVTAAALVLIVAVPVLSPTMRGTVTGKFGAGEAANGEHVAGGGPSIESKGGVAASPPDAQGDSMPATRAGGRNLGFGERITLGQARETVLLPRAAGLGEPDEVYAERPPHAGGVVLVYHARPGLPALGNTDIGLVLTERVGGIEAAYLPEDLRPGTEFERVEVDGKRGYWAPAGRGLSSRTGLLGGSVLLWERGALALRLEGDLPEEEAVRIAGSVR
jgi:hypothetical protein